MLDFNKIRTELLKDGYITEDALLSAKENVISISGEFTMDGEIIITSKKAGITGEGVFFKGLERNFDLPEIEVLDDEDETERKFKDDLKEMYPNLTVWVKIQ